VETVVSAGTTLPVTTGVILHPGPLLPRCVLPAVRVLETGAR
jgi:hypothetical protein